MNKPIQNCLQVERQSLQGDHRQWEHGQSSIHGDGGKAGVEDNYTSKSIQGIVVAERTSSHGKSTMPS